jgi:hypothetical protein
MRRPLLMPVLLLVASCLTACNSSSNPMQTRLGDLGKAEIEARVKESVKLSELSLTQAEKGVYTGTGKDAEGATYKVKVTQETDKISFEAENDKGWKYKGTEETKTSPQGESTSKTFSKGK